METLIVVAIAFLVLRRVVRSGRRRRAEAEFRRAFAAAHQALADQSEAIEAARAELADCIAQVAGLRDLLRRHGEGGGGEGRDDPLPSGPLPDPVGEFMARRQRVGERSDATVLRPGSAG